MSLRRWVIPLKLALTIGLLAVLWHLVADDALWSRLAQAHPEWLALGVLGNALCAVAYALRWRHTAGRIGVAISVGWAIREVYLSTFLNQVLPSGVAGDAVRAWRHGRRVRDQAGPTGDRPVANRGPAAEDALATGDRTEHQRASSQPDQAVDQPSADMGPAVRAVVIERVSNLMILSMSTLIGMALWPALPGALPGAQVWIPLIAASALILALVVLIRLISRRIGSGTIQRFVRDFVRVWLTRPSGFVQLGLGLAVLGTCVWVFACAAYALDAALSPLQLMALIPPVLLSMSLPISYGGWGPREASAVAMWAMAGLPGSNALMISLVYGGVSLLGSLPGALVLLFDRPRAPRPASQPHQR